MIKITKGRQPSVTVRIFVITYGVSFFLIMCLSKALALDIGVDPAVQNIVDMSSVSDQQVFEMNKNIKNVIEENQRLAQENDSIKAEMERLRQETLTHESRYSELLKERDGLANTIDTVRDKNRQVTAQARQLEENLKSLTARNEELESRSTTVQEKFSPQESDSFSDSASFDLAATETGLGTEPKASTEEVVEQESKTLDLLTKIDAFAEEDERLRMDAAKAHYNMGNIYYQKGEYEIAAREYYQAMTLMPDDPDAHYNLAFVSGEQLNDHRTALKHYRMYLYLSPDAKDTHLVREKIIKSRLLLNSVVDSPLEKREVDTLLKAE